MNLNEIKPLNIVIGVIGHSNSSYSKQNLPNLKVKLNY